MQFCFRVQLSKQQGGIDGDAIYVDTEDSFRSERIREMVSNYLKSFQIEESIVQFRKDEVLTRIHVRKLNTHADDLCDFFFNGELDSYLNEHPNVKLLVIDSMAYHFRYDYVHQNHVRVQQLAQITSKLNEIAYTRNIAVCVLEVLLRVVDLTSNACVVFTFKF